MCDITTEQNMNAIYLLNTTRKNHCILFFNTGAYQETIGGYGGLHHCLIPQPKHILSMKRNIGYNEVFQNNKLLMTY
jgi:arginine decarboxylase